MANFICLAAARSDVLDAQGWDAERDGLFGAPPIEVVVGEERHVSLELSLRYLGLGGERLRVVPVEEQGRMRADALTEALGRCADPVIVCAQAGNVNSGAFDPIGEICAAAHEYGAWVHVDGPSGSGPGRLPAIATSRGA